MSTLLDIKKQVAAFLRVTNINSLTIQGVDMFLTTANQIRQEAEFEHNFNFQRKLVKVTVSGNTGGNLSSAVDADNNPVTVKQVIDVGFLTEESGLFVPVEWTTTEESLVRQREDCEGFNDRYGIERERGDYFEAGYPRFTFTGDKVFYWPRTTESLSQSIELWLEVYAFSPGWSAATIDGTEEVTVEINGSPETWSAGGTFAGYPFYYAADNPATPYLYRTGSTWCFSSSLSNQSDSWTSPSDNIVGAYSETGTGVSGVTEFEVTAVGGSSTDVWTTHGEQYILWASIVQLNHIFRAFVPRVEGNLAPPIQMMTAALERLKAWDVQMYEVFRRHRR